MDFDRNPRKPKFVENIPDAQQRKHRTNELYAAQKNRIHHLISTETVKMLGTRTYEP